MRLSAYTVLDPGADADALRNPARVTVDEVAGTFGISRHHLVKVVHDLGRSGYLTTHRGVGGGFTLARPPEDIRLGDIVRLGEEAETVIECMDGGKHCCRLLPSCRLKGVLDEAAAAFFEGSDRYSFADLVTDRPNSNSNRDMSFRTTDMDPTSCDSIAPMAARARVSLVGRTPRFEHQSCRARSST